MILDQEQTPTNSTSPGLRRTWKSRPLNYLANTKTNTAMLGEDHSLINEFPEYKDLIAQLVANDEAFAKDAKHYDGLDEEIRNLELNGAPIDD